MSAKKTRVVRFQKMPSFSINRYRVRRRTHGRHLVGQRRPSLFFKPVGSADPNERNIPEAVARSVVSTRGTCRRPNGPIGITIVGHSLARADHITVGPERISAIVFSTKTTRKGRRRPYQPIPSGLRVTRRVREKLVSRLGGVVVGRVKIEYAKSAKRRYRRAAAAAARFLRSAIQLSSR